MANKVYQLAESATTFQASGGSFVLTFTSLADAAGRIGAQWDRGTASRPTRYKWRMKVKAAAALAVGTYFGLYLSTSDGTNQDGNLSTADAAQASINKLKNLIPVGTITADSTTNGELQIASGVIEIFDRYVSPVVWNALGQALTGTGTDHTLSFTPVSDEIQ